MLNHLAAPAILHADRLRQVNSHRVVERRSQVADRRPIRQMRGDRGENIPPMEHKTDDRQPISDPIQFHETGSSSRECSARSNQAGDRAIIGSHIEPIADPRRHWTAFCANTRDPPQPRAPIPWDNMGWTAQRYTRLPGCFAPAPHGLGRKSALSGHIPQITPFITPPCHL
jgi:hypothetical protein